MLIMNHKKLGKIHYGNVRITSYVNVLEIQVILVHIQHLIELRLR